MAMLIPAALGGTGTLGTLLGVAGTVIGGMSSVQDAHYQGAIASRNVATETANAAKAIETAGQDAQMQDESASQEMGAMLSAASSSGLSLGVGSMALRQQQARDLASRDRQRIVEGGTNAATDALQRAEAQKAEAAAAKSRARMGVLSTVLGVAGAYNDTRTESLISDAPRIAPRRSMRPRARPRSEGF